MIGISRTNIRQTLLMFSCLLNLMLVLNCAKKDSPNQGELPDDATNQQSPFDGAEEVGPTIDTKGSNSNLSSTDKEALGKLTTEFADVQPEDDGSELISQQLEAEMEQLLAEERAGRDVAVQKIALAGKMMAECASRIADLAPVPGQPLLGEWLGQGCPIPSGKFVVPGPAVGFNIDDAAGLGPGKGRKPGAPPVYKVAGGTNGEMQANPEGAGAIKAAPWAGTVSDTGLNGRAGAGTVTNPQYSSTKYGFTPCAMGVSLRASRNPIPENYVQAMRKAGKCFRKTLFLMSPVMDGLFKNMDPQLAQVLKARMLGIK